MSQGDEPLSAVSRPLSQQQLNDFCNVLGQLVAVIRKRGLQETYDELCRLAYSDVSTFDPKTGRD